MSTPSQLTINISDPVCTASEGEEHRLNNTPNIRDGVRDPGHHRPTPIPLEAKDSTCGETKGKRSRSKRYNTRNKGDNTNRANGPGVSNIDNFPVKFIVCKAWVVGRCAGGEQCRFRHDAEPERMTFEAFQTKPSQKGSMSPLEAAKQDYKQTLAYESMVQQATEAAHQTLQFRQEECTHCNQKHEENLVREKANYESFKEREKQRYALALQRAEKRYKQIVASEDSAYQSSVAAKKQVFEEATKEHEGRLVEREAARKAREAAATEYRQLEVLREASVTEQCAVLRESTLITYGAGLEMQDVVAGFDTCRIIIKNLPRDAKRNEVSDMFTQQGMIHSEFLVLDLRPKENHQEATVLAVADRGQVMAIGLDGVEFRDHILTAKVSENSNDACVLTISWRVPSATMIATYSSMEEATEKATNLNGKPCKGQQIGAEMNQPSPVVLKIKSYVPSSIKLTGFPLGTCIDQEIYDFAGTSDIKSLKSFTLQDIFDLLLRHLKTFQNMKMDSDQLPDPINGRMVVSAKFENWEDAKKAYESLNRKKLPPNSPVFSASLPNLVQDRIIIPQQQYKAQERQWNCLSEKRPESDAYVHIRQGHHGVYMIQVVGQDKKVVGFLKVRVGSMVAGEKLDSSFWHPSFTSSSASGKDFFDRVYAEKNVYVRHDFKAKALKIYGEEIAKEEARQMIKEEVNRLAQLETTVTLDQASVSFFRRGGLGKLKELVGTDGAVALNFDSGCQCWKITIKGQDENRRHLYRLIEESRMVRVSPEHLDGKDQPPCPICIDEISHTEQLGCGHNYCSGCLRHYLVSAPETKMFPLVCITCKVPISIPLIRRFLTPQAFQALVETAFSSYLSEPGRKLKYCRTADCEQIYHQSDDPRVRKCPLCFSTVCSACGEEAHEGMTCHDSKLSKDPSEQDRLFKLWTAATKAQQCPGCKATIEKIDGCNHIICSHCQTHFCWICLFTGSDIYGHLNQQHGGVY
ncbi:hypothetical protein BYT27DRAFT_7211843 [Phlegmacium glaucopus]|nr:hypothetical protein BYT27DRAFT_7211843 [Phlegmacium glaucopus]